MRASPYRRSPTSAIDDLSVRAIRLDRVADAERIRKTRPSCSGWAAAFFRGMGGFGAEKHSRPDPARQPCKGWRLTGWLDVTGG